LKKIYYKLLNEPELIQKPPVLIDIGASEQIHSKWKHISKYSICIAFDADQRDFRVEEKEKSRFKKLIVYNCIASDKDENKTDFFLTKSPYCSSVLQPDIEKLKPYINSYLFEVVEKNQQNSIHIQKALNQSNIDYVDWIKIDSQGIDLRLFNSLDEKIKNKILVAEFEPGIIDAYIGEDKLYSVLKDLNYNNFWLSDFIIKGVARFPKESLESEFKGKLFKKLIKESLKKSPGWGEMTFINNFENYEFYKRDYLLGWLFSTLERQHSFAFTLASKGFEKFNSDIFAELKHYSKNNIKKQVYSFNFIPSLIELIKKKLIR
jgi:hypothetical protein